MINMNTGRTVISSNREHTSPSSYVFYHWYDPPVDSDADIDATDTDKVAKHDTNTNIMSSVLHIFNSDMMNNGDREEHDLLSSIYEDILDPVIKSREKNN